MNYKPIKLKKMEAINEQTNRKNYEDLKRELQDLNRFDLSDKLIDLYFNVKKVEFSRGLDKGNQITKKVYNL